MAGYDPKQKRAHSPAAEEGPAPVDDLLAGPPPPPAATRATTTASPPSPTPARAVTAPRPVSPAPTGPDPKVLALAAGALVAVLLAWRWRRR